MPPVPPNAVDKRVLVKRKGMVRVVVVFTSKSRLNMICPVLSQSIPNPNLVPSFVPAAK